ncbi:hypothetical protein EXN66_Car001121 [Channa argus]|uniref:Uncharacterized protein n=1 Tax=Channa argus TaxID=215402 RepID=A0A6G1R0G3_CHAAH|nr:hypothetical protein EXN66_Car001121 [Channa argus]
MERRRPIHHSLALWSSHCHSTETLSNKDGMKAEACHAQEHKLPQRNEALCEPYIDTAAAQKFPKIILPDVKQHVED